MKETSEQHSSTSYVVNTKRAQRLERKKRKIAALAEVMRLTEIDRGTLSTKPEDSGTSAAETASKKQFTDTDYRMLKAEVNQKRDRMRNLPKLRLKQVGEEALLTTPPEDRVPLLLDDIQGLLMHTLLRTDSPMNPNRWATLEKSSKLSHTIVLLVEGLTLDDFVEHEADFRECKKIFHNILHVVTPGYRLVEELASCSTKSSSVRPSTRSTIVCDNLEGLTLDDFVEHEADFRECKKIFHNILHVVTPGYRLVEELACVPLSDSHKDILLAEYGSLEAAMLACKDHLLIRKSIFQNIGSANDESDEQDYSNIDMPPDDKFPRTQLLLSPIQMINEDYPLPLTGSLQHRYAGYITTNDRYAPVTPKSPIFALDCEMCKTSIGASELTRVSIVDEQGVEFYETLVRPNNKIVDYLTQFSGITADMMKNVSKTLRDVHKDLRNKLPPDAILVGQSLNFDLNALKIMHPYVIDTSILYNVTGTPGTKTKLKVLTKKFLHREIQCSSKGHNSIEDCSAALELVKLKLSKNIYFGDQWLQDRRNYHKKASKMGIATQDEVNRIGVEATNATDITTTIFGHARKKNKKSAIVTNAENLYNFESYFGEAIKANGEVKKLLNYEKLNSDQAVVETTVEKCLNYDFHLSCIQLKQDDLGSTDAKRAKIKQIDGWIRQLYTSMSLSGMLVVLLAGGEVNQSSRMAVAMIQTKKD